MRLALWVESNKRRREDDQSKGRQLPKIPANQRHNDEADVRCRTIALLRAGHGTTSGREQGMPPAGRGGVRDLGRGRCGGSASCRSVEGYNTQQLCEAAESRLTMDIDAIITHGANVATQSVITFLRHVSCETKLSVD